MSLMSRTSDTHNHLARKLTKKHAVRPGHPAASSAENPRERPFGAIHVDGSASNTPSAYKPIFRI